MSMPTLLIVDDMPENIQLLAGYLGDPYRIRVASSGPEALERIAEALPDLILLDAMMPGMDGYDVCGQLQRDPRTREIPILFVTAKNDAESESRALAAGAVDFIHKPVNRDVVRARVQMHLELKARERELRSANVQLNDLNGYLEQRVEERTQALRDAMLLAEAAHKAKHLFLAKVNHELRTPMNAILGLSELLAKQAGDSRVKTRVDKIRQACEQLLSVVNDIIDVANLQAGRVKLDPLEFAVEDLVGDTVETWHGRARDKGLTLTREIDPAFPRALSGDRVRLGQILDNLVGNAIKFSERGTIAVRASLTKIEGPTYWVRFEVADPGIGIGKSTQASIFEVFEQADNSETRKHGGCGLGLALCKQLTSLTGGKIGVDSTPGQGSTFWVMVPLVRWTGPAAEAARPQPPADPDVSQRHRLAWENVQYVMVPMISLLAANDFGGYRLWMRERELLDEILGDRAKAFNTAMERVDLQAALEVLRAVRALYTDR